MRPLLFRLACSLVLLSFAAIAAYAAGVPSPPNSTTDRVVVGNTSGTPMGGGVPGYDVVVRDLNNLPVGGARVILDFSNASIRLYAVQNAGTTLDCVARTLARMANAAGVVSFAARIGRYDNANAIRVIADGVLLNMVPGRSTDINGVGGQASLSDFVLFSANYNTPAAETDFDENGMTGLNDLALFATEYNGPVQPYCP
jgi:hypothetical protein